MSNPSRLLLGASIQRLLIVSALVTTLSACSMQSTQHKEDLPVAADWPSDARWTQDNGVTAPDLGWRDYFTDPQLSSLIEAALVNNRDLRVAVLRVKEARSLYGIQRSEQFPTFDVGGQSARSRVPGDLNLSGRSVVSGNYSAYVGLNSWEMDLWGRVSSLKDAALHEYLATEAAQRGVQLTLVAAVAEAYLGLRELDERIGLAREMVTTREESHRIFTRRNQVGSISELDLIQVETLLNQARVLEAQLQQARAAQAHALTLLVGMSMELPPIDGKGLRDEAVFAPLRAGLPSDLLTWRPDIVAAEHRLLSAQANIHAARAAFLPRIALTGTFGSASAELDGLFDSGSRAWTFLPTISLPIFDAGRRRAGVELAEVRRDTAVASYERAIQVAFREVSDALSAQQWLTQQVAIQRHALVTQTKRAQLAQLRYNNGAAAYLEVLDAQRDLLDAQQQLVQVRRALLSTRIDLYNVLGGGSAIDTGESQASAATATR